MIEMNWLIRLGSALYSAYGRITRRGAHIAQAQGAGGFVLPGRQRLDAATNDFAQVSPSGRSPGCTAWS